MCELQLQLQLQPTELRPWCGREIEGRRMGLMKVDFILGSGRVGRLHCPECEGGGIWQLYQAANSGSTAGFRLRKASRVKDPRSRGAAACDSAMIETRCLRNTLYMHHLWSSLETFTGAVRCWKHGWSSSWLVLAIGALPGPKVRRKSDWCLLPSHRRVSLPRLVFSSLLLSPCQNIVFPSHHPPTR